MNVKIEMYDPACKEAPYQFIKLDEFKIPNVIYNAFDTLYDLGATKASYLRGVCLTKGYSFKFYTPVDENTIVITVRDPNEKRRSFDETIAVLRDKILERCIK